MQGSSLFPTFAKLATIAALCVPFVAHAEKNAGAGVALSGLQHSLVAVGPSATSSFMVDVTGIKSMDLQGSANNEWRSLNVGANAHVIGIGWDVNLLAQGLSWLSEIKVSFGSTSSTFINLTPGVGDNTPGASNYSSGGVVDLVGLALDFNVDADGMLHMEFFEGFDDVPGGMDGLWESGALTIQTAAVPEPGTYAMMLLGLAAMGGLARRRKA